MPQGCLGGAGSNATGRQERSVGVPQSVNVDRTAPVVALVDTSGCQVAIENFDKLASDAREQRSICWQLRSAGGIDTQHRSWRVRHLLKHTRLADLPPSTEPTF